MNDKNLISFLIIQVFTFKACFAFSPLFRHLLQDFSNDLPRPPSVREITSKDTVLVVKIDLPASNDPVKHLSLYYRDERSPWNHVVFPARDKTEYELTNLKPSTSYELYLKADGSKGSSEKSQIYQATTLGERNDLDWKSYERSTLEREERKVPPYLNSYFVIPIAIAVVIVVIVCAASYVYLEREEKKVALMHAGLMTPSASKNFQYISNTSTPSRGQNVVFEESSLTLRYSDYSDRGKLLLARPTQQQQQQPPQLQQPNSSVLWAQKQGPIVEEAEEYPAPYETLPIHQNGKKNSPPPLPPPNLPPPILKTFTGQAPNQLLQPSSSSASSPPTHNQNQNLFDPDNSQRQNSHNPPDSSQQSSVFCKADVHYDMNCSTPAYDFFTFHRV